MTFGFSTAFAATFLTALRPRLNNHQYFPAGPRRRRTAPKSVLASASER